MNDLLVDVLAILDAHGQMLRTLPYESRARVKLREVEARCQVALADLAAPEALCECGHDRGSHLRERLACFGLGDDECVCVQFRASGTSSLAAHSRVDRPPAQLGEALT